MSLGQSIAKNTLIQAAGKAVSTLIGLVVVALITRYLSPAGYGQYTTVITFLSFFGVVADFGLTLITAQMISERGADEPRILRSIFSFRVASALVIYALAPVVGYFLPYPSIVKLGIALAAGSFFFVSLNQTLIGVFQKRLQMIYPSIAENIGRLALLLITVWAIWSHANLAAFLVAVVIGNVVNFFFTLWYARRFVAVGFGWDGVVLRDLIRRAAPIAISIVFNLIYLKADTLILSWYRPDYDVGLYGAAYRVIDILMMLPVMIMGVALPAITAAYSGAEKERVRHMIQKLFSAFVVYALPLLLGGWLLAGPLMALVAGQEFFASGAPLRILLGAFMAATFSTLFGHLVVALGRQRQAIWIYGVDAALALAAYLYFIPRFGMAAAAWATFGSEVFAAICLWWLVRRVTGVRLSWGVPMVAFIGAVTMSVLLVQILTWSVFAAIALGGAWYLAVILVARVHKKLI